MHHYPYDSQSQLHVQTRMKLARRQRVICVVQAMLLFALWTPMRLWTPLPSPPRSTGALSHTFSSCHTHTRARPHTYNQHCSHIASPPLFIVHTHRHLLHKKTITLGTAPLPSSHQYTHRHSTAQNSFTLVTAPPSREYTSPPRPLHWCDFTLECACVCDFVRSASRKGSTNFHYNRRSNAHTHALTHAHMHTSCLKKTNLSQNATQKYMYMRAHIHNAMGTGSRTDTRMQKRTHARAQTLSQDCRVGNPLPKCRSKAYTHAHTARGTGIRTHAHKVGNPSPERRPKAHARVCTHSQRYMHRHKHTLTRTHAASRNTGVQTFTRTLLKRAHTHAREHMYICMHARTHARVRT